MSRLPPATVLLYEIKWAAILAVAVVAGLDGTVALSVLLMTVLLVALWRGSRLAWGLLILVEAGLALTVVFDAQPWWVLMLSLVALALLLARPTRDHVAVMGTEAVARPKARDR